MTTIVGTSTATAIILSIEDLPPQMPAASLVDNICSLVFMAELSIYVASASTKSPAAEPKAPAAELEGVVRVQRLHYGSPIQIVIDLAPIVHFVQDAGIVAVMAVLMKLSKDGSEVWKNLEEAAAARRARRNIQKGYVPAGNWRTRRLEAQRLEEVESDSFNAALEAVVSAAAQALQETGKIKNTDHASERMRSAGRIFLEYSEEATHEAAKTLRKATIEVELD